MFRNNIEYIQRRTIIFSSNNKVEIQKKREKNKIIIHTSRHGLASINQVNQKLDLSNIEINKKPFIPDKT